jgi:hypothetical protein
MLQNFLRNYHNCSSTSEYSAFTDFEYSLPLSQKPECGARLIHHMPLQHVYLEFILILLFHLRLYFTSSFFVHVFLTCLLTRLPLLSHSVDLNIPIMLCEEYNL